MNRVEKLRCSTLLIVDDEPANLHVLKQILQDGYRLLFARDGSEALEVCRKMLPDLILLDVKLPGISGYEVCRELKRDADTARIPVIFVSVMSDIVDEAHGFDAGGVDYITKPVSPAIVRARVATHLSLVGELQETLLAKTRLREINAELENYKKFSEYELEIAHELMDHMIRKSSAQIPDVELWIESATTLSGDMVLTQDYCGERSYILIADAMGHGLPAALPLMPIVQVFSASARARYTVSAIVREMNARVVDLIPVGTFVAVTLLGIDRENRVVEIWNGGNPPAIVHGRQGPLQKFPSRHHALGVARDGMLDSKTELFQWNEDCWLTLYSDGLVEAQNAQGTAFGEERIAAALSSDAPHRALKDSILEHLGGQGAHDDISIATVRLGAPAGVGPTSAGE